MGSIRLLILLFLLTFTFLAPTPVYAAWSDDCTTEVTIKKPHAVNPPVLWETETIKDVVPISGIVCIIKNIISPFPALIVLAALGMILFASVRIILSGSDPKAYASGMQTLLFAIIGIILLSAAWLILVLVERFTGAKVTEFGIPTPTP